VPCPRRLACTATNDAVEVERLHRVNGHFEAALGTQPTQPSLFIAIDSSAYTSFADGLSQALDIVFGWGCR
jgi:hypothetical protein